MCAEAPAQRLEVARRSTPTSHWRRFSAVIAGVLLAACGGGGGGGDAAPAATSPVPIGNPVIVSVSATPTSLTLGESTTLSWSSSNATACNASGDWSGAVGLSGSQLVTPSAVGMFTYTLTCDGVARSTSVAVVAAESPAPTVSLSIAPVSVSSGQSATLTWSSSNATSCVASGAWADPKAVSGSVVVVQATAGNYLYNLECTGPAGRSTGSATLSVTDLVDNVTAIVVDSGPAAAGKIINVPFVSVTVCRPGTSTCQTIDHVLVDTGSYGLRIIGPDVLDPALALPAITGPTGAPIGECVQFFSGFFWGSVHRADVKIAGETAPSLPVQQVSPAAAEFQNVPAGCSNIGGDIGTVANLGAKGILGVGLFNQDCGTACTARAVEGTYYECTASGNCTAIMMPLADQVANPVAAFSRHNNGVAIVMPSVASGGATTLSGALVFGIGSQPNNQVGAATVYSVDSGGNFTTTYKGLALTSSFLDTGSNGLFFPDAGIPLCASSGGFYCPPATLSLSAVNTSANGAASGTVNFVVENLERLAPSVRAASVGGIIDGGAHQVFDWGLPFFFGRTVFIAIEDADTSHGPGPYWAY